MRNPDFVNFEPKTQFTRREFVMTTLASGFAMAVQPIAAQTRITTDANGLEAGEVKIRTGDGEIPGYRAQPGNVTALRIALVQRQCRLMGRDLLLLEHRIEIVACARGAKLVEHRLLPGQHS